MNKPVQVTIGEHAASFVARELESGRCETADDVIEAGLRMLEDEQMKIERLRELLIESENNGPGNLFDREALMASFRASRAKNG
ncbi:antitoxin ParD1/3/4 [Neorhizobium huautlense]|uniref:Antitoxin ParD1/3/4 n=1 Tax=Neorhizobium huautlense TaxID=67774 RepID=A0ABT9PT47_9HYPH|nr:type II toxin-antitoxin system ParD family antitoxin [Neorhizobium huautlense]MDP9837629.1 antitoxin ParD1/3/4 [Neorhizobium huautlense]